MSGCCSTVFDACDLPSQASSAGECWGDKVASFERTVREKRASLIWLARRLTPFSEDAEDIVQESLLRAYNNLSHFRGDAKMSTWIQSIVRNTACDWMRRQRGRVVLSLEHIRNEDDESPGFDVSDPARSPEDLLAISELERIMLAEIDKLGEGYRNAITMCQLGELPQKEVASLFKVNVLTMKSRIFKAKASLRKSMLRIGNTNPASQSDSRGRSLQAGHAHRTPGHA